MEVVKTVHLILDNREREERNVLLMYVINQKERRFWILVNVNLAMNMKSLLMIKRNANLKNITRLKLDNNAEVTESSGILNELSKFYENLYKANHYHDSFENEFLSDIVPKISHEQRESCDREISMHECN